MARFLWACWDGGGNLAPSLGIADALERRGHSVTFAHDALFKRARLVVTHGGHGTAMRALSRGVPMVMTPALAGDQPFVIAAVEEWGAARALPRDASVAAIRSAAEVVLGNDSYQRRASQVSTLLAGQDGAVAAAAALEEIAGISCGSTASARNFMTI